MSRFAFFVCCAALSTSAHANIINFTPPVATGGGSVSSSFTPLTATGFYLAGQGEFNNDWLVSVDSANPSLSFTVENRFNPRNGGGALSFSNLTVAGPGVDTVSLTQVPLPCVVGFGDCITRYVGSFAVSAGNYTLNVSGGNPFNGSYSVAVLVVPEPPAVMLTSGGLLLLGLAVGRRRKLASRRIAHPAT